MPKKFQGENSKAAAARARKDAVRKEAAERKKQAEEDAYWKDDDKNIIRKQQRKEDAEKKRMEALQRKLENRKAAEEEINAMAAKPSVAAKVTRAEIDERRRREAQIQAEEERERQLKEQKLEILVDEVEENVNKLSVEGETARTVAEAIEILTGDDVISDRHPEKRVRAAYLAFEERRIPELKIEHPTFRLSQLRQLLKKEWQKSPENPLNQKILSIIK
ncbi:hypothetical protein AB6A40_005194 [Gnathostoma spinigerum]|uniref:Coiled-coil domain-containing protein n=1 Tax=Gnathostoma spinigerum TaxID=75299 RepID=A0ABD6EEQ4_9BILA